MTTTTSRSATTLVGVSDQTTSNSDVDESPRRGRPRTEGVDASILSATLELAGEVGINGMSMDELAKRAGVSKATIYRRWKSKEALVIEALKSAMSPFDNIDTGSLASDLDTYLSELADRMNSGRMNDILPHLIEVATHDEALRASLDEYIRHRRSPLVTILTHAVERSELPAATDIEIVIDALLGPFVYRRLLTSEAMDDDFVTRLLAVVLPNR